MNVYVTKDFTRAMCSNLFSGEANADISIGFIKLFNFLSIVEMFSLVLTYKKSLPNKYKEISNNNTVNTNEFKDFSLIRLKYI